MLVICDSFTFLLAATVFIFYLSSSRFLTAAMSRSLEAPLGATDEPDVYDMLLGRILLVDMPPPDCLTLVRPRVN